MTETYKVGDPVFWHLDNGGAYKAEVLRLSMAGKRVKIQTCVGELKHQHITYVKPTSLSHRADERDV